MMGWEQEQLTQWLEVVRWLVVREGEQEITPISYFRAQLLSTRI